MVRKRTRLPVSIYHDPFARCSVMRETVLRNDKCAWCGSDARFTYGTIGDDKLLDSSINWDARSFCGIECKRSYYS